MTGSETTASTSTAGDSDRPLLALCFLGPTAEELSSQALSQQAILAQRVLDAGIEPDLLLGHGSGELAALVLGGAWELDTAQAALEARDRAQRRAATQAPELAAMRLACPSYQREALLALAGADVITARQDAPAVHVLAGTRDSVERTVEGAAVFGARVQLLTHHGALHTPWLEPARQEYRQDLEQFPCTALQHPVLSTSGARLPAGVSEPQLLAEQLAAQLVSTLDLPAALERAHQQGARHFLVLEHEEGAGAVVSETLAELPHEVCLLSTQDSSSDALRQARVFLAATGHLPVHALDAADLAPVDDLRALPGAPEDLLPPGFATYLEREEPAVLALLREVYRRYCSQQPAPAPKEASPDPGPTPAAQPAAPQRAPAPTEPPPPPAPEILPPPVDLLPQTDPPPGVENQDLDQDPDEHGLALYTVGSQPLERAQQQPFPCRRILALGAGGDPCPVVERLRGAGIHVLALRAASVAEMNQAELELALADCDSLAYLAHRELVETERRGDALIDALAWHTSLFLRVFRALAPALHSRPLRVLVPLSQDGAFGTGPRTPARPLGAFPAGLVRSLQAALPRCRLQLVDGGDLPWAEALEQRIDWLSPHLELGRSAFGMVTPTLVPLGQTVRRGGLLRPGELVLVTGGAQGFTFQCARSLARVTGARLLILGERPSPSDHPAWLDTEPEALDEALQQLQRDLVRGRGKSPAEASSSAALARLQWADHRSLAQLRAEGIDASYEPCDIHDTRSLARMLRRVAQRTSLRALLLDGMLAHAEPSSEGAELSVTQAAGPLLRLVELLDPSRLALVAAIVPEAGWSATAEPGTSGLAGDLLAWLAQGLQLAHPGLRTLVYSPPQQARGVPQATTTEDAADTGARLFLDGLLGSDRVRLAATTAFAASEVRRPLAVFPLAPRARERLVDAPKRAVPRVRLTRARDLWLDQHRVNDEPTVPPAFVAEIFTEVASTRNHLVQDLRFRRSMPVRGGSLVAEVMELDDRLLLVPRERSDLPARALARLAWARCRTRPCRSEAPPAMGFSPRELLALHEAAQEAEIPCYTLLQERFAPILGLGPIFRGIRSTLHVGDRFLGLVSLADEAVAALALPGAFAFQPVLAEVALQVAMTWALEEHDRLALPHAIGAIRILEPSREREAVVVCKARELSSDRFGVDLVLREPDGRPLLALDELVLQALADPEEEEDDSPDPSSIG